jgi:hypothetical protein
MTNRYVELGAGIFSYLANCCRGNRCKSIYDEVAGSVTPDGQYAHTFFVLAGVQLAVLTHDYSHLETIKPVLDYYSRLPRTSRGYAEFNHMASLLSLVRLADFEGQDLPLVEEINDQLSAVVRTLDLESGRWTLHGNNWIAIRAFDLALSAEVMGKRGNSVRANKLVDDLVLKWQLVDGVFYDAPRSVRARQVETPLTYHAKFCMLALLINWILDRGDVRDAALRGLQSLGELIAPDGEVCYFGRSNNALFGYVSALCAYEMAVEDAKNANDLDSASQYRLWADRLFEYLAKHQLPSGAMPITLGETNGLKDGWDSYMSHTVYNSYAAAVLSMCSHEELSRRPPQMRVSCETTKLDSAGFCCITAEDFFCAFHMRGQRLQPRYAGLTPLSLQSKGKHVLPKAPVRSECGPLIAGFLPLVKLGTGYYSAFRWAGSKAVCNGAQVVLSGRAVWFHMQEGQGLNTGIASGATRQRVRYLLRVMGFSRVWRSYRQRYLQKSLGLAVDRLVIVFPSQRCILAADRYVCQAESAVVVFPFNIMCLSNSYELERDSVRILDVSSGEVLCTVFNLSPVDGPGYVTYAGYDTSDGPSDLILANRFRLGSGDEFHQISLIQVSSSTAPAFQITGVEREGFVASHMSGFVHRFHYNS